MQSAIYCPRDNTELNVQIQTNIHLGYCPTCRGTWYFGDSIAKLLSLEKHPELLNFNKNVFQQTQSEMACPLCQENGQMVGKVFKNIIDDDHSVCVTIDQCHCCHGVWFDKGELPQTRQFLRHHMAKLAETRQQDRLRIIQSLEKHKKLVYTEDGIKQNRLMRAYPVTKTDTPLPRIIHKIPNMDAMLFEEERNEDEEAEELGEGVEGAEISTPIWFFVALTGLPVEAYNPPRKNFPYVTLGIIFLCILVQFLVSLGNSDSIYQNWGATPYNTKWFTLITSIFLHSGWIHLLCNMYFLWVFGDNVEDRLGHIQFGLFYLAVGVFAGMLQLASMHLNIPCVGASGAIAGIMGAYLFLFPRSALYQVFFLIYPVKVPVFIYLGIWATLQYIGFRFNLHGVGWIAHLGGFGIGFGVVLAWYAIRRAIRGPMPTKPKHAHIIR